MSHSHVRWIVGLSVAAISGGCTTYQGVVKPVGNLKALSPELASFSDQKIEAHLSANARPPFPCTLAVARLTHPGSRYGHRSTEAYRLEAVTADEADAWRKIAHKSAGGNDRLVSQVQFISPLLGGPTPDLKALRDAAAMLHAPLLLVYAQSHDQQSGYNDAAMAYWTIVGLFFVPGNSVGCYSACQALLVDTRTGLIYATAEGESKREEHVLAGAANIAERRTEQQARADAVKKLQSEVERALFGTWITAATAGR